MSINRWVEKNMVYTYLEYYSAIKWNETDICYNINTENIMQVK